MALFQKAEAVLFIFLLLFPEKCCAPLSFKERIGTTLVIENLEKATLFIKASHQITKWPLPTS